MASYHFHNVIFKCSNILLASIFAYALYYDYQLTKSFHIFPVPGVYLSKLIWLTMINLWLQCFYHSFAALFAYLDVKTSSVMQPFHFFATAIGFPVSTTVVGLFWSIYHLDPSFLITDDAKILMAVQWFNHSIHTLPLAAMMLDHFIWRHPRPAKRSAFFAILVFIIIYIIDIHYFYWAYGRWPYPILGQMILPVRLLFVFFCSLFVFANFLLGDAFNGTIVHWWWRRQKRERRREKKAN